MSKTHLSLSNGHVIAKLGEKEFTLSPTFMRMDRIGSPAEIVETYGMMFGTAAVAVRAAMLIITCCANDEVTELIGYYDEKLNRVAGAMPVSEMIIIAMHLMKHGIVGKATKAKEGSGSYSAEFDPSEYVDAAVIHFGISQVEAWALTMTQFGRMLEMKFPEKKKAEKISIDEYKEQRDFYLSRHKAKAAANGE